MAKSRGARGPFIPVTLALMLAASAAVVPARSASSVATVTARKAAPALSLKDASGKAHRLSDYKGQVVLLDFWATWCTGCKLEIPWFMEFDKKYKSEGLTSIGVAVDEEGWKTVKPYLSDHPITYPVVLGDFHVLEKTFGLPASLPVTLLIDRKGRIAQTHPGVVERENFEADIRLLLAESAR
jgi:cytochrome c biogenesis protein CcmG/thiol:disulfide interchange protein DsbE